MRLLFVIMSFFLLGTASASAELVAVSSNLADIRSSPSLVVSTVLLQVPKYYPLSAQGAEGDFLKVTDYLGNTGWVQKTSIDNTRTVIVKEKTVNLRQGAGRNNPVIFKVDGGVAFKVMGEKGNWLQVEHETGVTGWLFKDLVWSN